MTDTLCVHSLDKDAGMLSSRLSEYNRVWSCPAYRALILTEAPDTGADGERERKRDGWRKRAKEGGKSKAWKDWIEGGIGERLVECVFN